MNKQPRRAARAIAVSLTCLGAMVLGGIATAPPALADTAAGLARAAVVGPDERTPVTNTLVYPNSAVVQILSWGLPNCSGALIAPNVVLTAGHCVKLNGLTFGPAGMTVVPGRNGAVRPYGSCPVTEAYTDPKWTGQVNAGPNDHEYDWALLRLGCNIGQTTGVFAYRSGTFTNQVVTTRGYPGDKPTGTMWAANSTITGTGGLVLVSALDQMGGQSGSPVFTADNSIVGVASASWYCDDAGYSCTHATATRLTEARVATIRAQVAKWACTPVVRVWSDVDLKGNSYAYCPGDIIPMAGAGVPGLANDTMSSLEILDPGWEVTLYEHNTGLGGGGVKLGPIPQGSHSYNLTDFGFNDRTSVMSITAKTSTIQMFADVHPGSGPAVVSVKNVLSSAAVLPAGLNDTISSILVPQGRMVSLFEDANFTGHAVILGPGLYNLTALTVSGTTDTWNDRVSSYATL